MEEQWRGVVGYEDYYEVSSLGKVRTKIKTCKGKLGSTRTLQVRYLKNRYTCQPFGRRDIVVCLHVNNNRKDKLLSRIVCEAFYGEANGREVNHIDGNSENNRVENLEWCTKEENTLHSIKIGRHKATKCKAFKDGVAQEFYSTGDAARKLGLFQANIWKCLKGKRRHTGGYVFEKL